MVDLYDGARVFNHDYPGFSGRDNPTPEQCIAQMQRAIETAGRSQMPLAARFGGGYVQLVAAHLARLAPDAGALLSGYCRKPEAQPFVKSLEFALAALAERSPESYEHIKHHTALAMMAFPALHGDIKGHEGHALQALFGALGHDIGKLGIAPDLLHKNSRLEPNRFAAALARFEASVPDYPQKAHDLAFLKAAQRGEIVFSHATDNRLDGQSQETVELKDRRQSESYGLPPDELLKHSRILARIHMRASAAIANEWLKPEELAALASPVYGTLTRQEKAIMAAHDPMSAAFFALQQPLPDPLKPLPDIVNMAQKPASPEVAEIHQILKLTDVFEALTADRSYRRAYPVARALAIMDGMAQKGELDMGLYQKFKDSGVWYEFAKHTGRELGEVAPPAKKVAGDRLQVTGNDKAFDKLWVTRVSATPAHTAATLNL